MDKQAEYLKLLQERNRLKKLMSAKSKEEQLKEDLEKGFSTHFRAQGNTKTEKSSHIYPTVKNAVITAPINIPFVSNGQKKGWGKPEQYNLHRNNREFDNIDAQDDEVEWTDQQFADDSVQMGNDDVDATNNDNEYDNTQDELDNEYLQQQYNLNESDIDNLRASMSVKEEKGVQDMLNSTADVDSLLLMRIGNMDKKQKQQLFKLLQHDGDLLQPTSPEKQSKPSSIQESSLQHPKSKTVLLDDNMAVDTEESGDVLHKGVSGKRSSKSLGDYLSANSNDVKQPQFETLPNNDIAHHSYEASVVTSSKHVPLMSSSCNTDSLVSKISNVCLKIRIYSIWDKRAKFVSLKALRLRLVYYNDEGCRDFIDLMSTLNPSFHTGLTQLPTTSECMRNFGILTATGVAGKKYATSNDKQSLVVKGSDNSVWRAPFSSDNPLDITLQGNFSDSANSIISKHFEHISDVYNAIELLVWNSNESSVKLSNACSPARDVDVYMDKQCVWSGELQEGMDGDKGDYAYTEQEQLLRPNGEISASAVVKPFSKLIAGPTVGKETKSSGSSAQYNAHASDIKSEVEVPKASSDFPIYDSPRSKKKLSSGSIAASSVVDSNLEHTVSGRPDWLRGDQVRVSNAIVSNDNYSDDFVQHTPDRSSNHNVKSDSAARSRRSLRTNEQLLQSPRQDKQNAGGVSDSLDMSRNSTSVSKGVDLFASPTKPIHPASGRRNRGSVQVIGAASDVSTADGNVTTSLVKATSKTSASPSSKDKNATHSASHPRRASRHTKTHQLDNTESSHPHHHSAVNAREDDAQVRQSLDAIQLAEHHNLGRLANNTLHGSGGKLWPVQETESLSPVPIALGLSSPTGSNSSLNVSSSTRISRIAQVNERIQSAVSGLAHIISEVGDRDSLAVSRRVKRGSGQETLSGIDTSDAEKHVTNPPSDAVVAESNKEQLPSGRKLVIEVLSTWGDANYVGLNGLEMYDAEGRLVMTSRVQDITAHPTGLRTLPNGRDDPRKVENLLNGMNFTRNDLYVWLAPLKHEENSNAETTSAAIATVTLTFKNVETLSMLRVFNMNKSRTHNQRGVRNCRILIDGHIIYEGEIKKADAQLLSVEAESHSIVFASDKALLSKLKKAIAAQDLLAIGEDEPETDPLEESISMAQSRPKTAMTAESSTPSSPQRSAAETAINTVSNSRSPEGHIEKGYVFSPEDTMRRSLTQERALERSMNALNESNAYLAQMNKLSRMKDSSPPPKHDEQFTSAAQHNQQPFSTFSPAISSTKLLATAPCRVLRIEIESTWGDPSYVGLCGLEVLYVANSQLLSVPLENSDIDAYPRDLSSVGFFDDPRRLENLLNGVNDCATDEQMWLIPYTKNSSHHIQIQLKQSFDVAGIRLWNYNKSSEDVLRGVKRISILLDKRKVCTAIVRMGPGCDGVSYGQTILFEDILYPSNPVKSLPDKKAPGSSLSHTPAAVRQDYEVSSISPCGLLWRFTFFDNWNDEFYLGLDRIEMYDSNHALIDMTACGAQINAVPYSVQDLATSQNAGLSHDPRTPISLFKASFSSHHNQCWLCPLSRCMTPDERIACVRRIQGNAKAPLENLNFPKNNTLFVSFQVPTVVTVIKLFNYSKSPARGVRDFSIDLDGQLLYMGTLQPAHKEKVSDMGYGRQSGGALPSRGQSFVFTNEVKAVNLNKDLVTYCGAVEQDVLCINERQVMVRSRAMYDQSAPNVSLEGVEADLAKRPSTAFVR